MKDHDILSSLYTVREMINCHLSWLRQGGRANERERARKNIEVLQKAHAQISRSLEMVQDLRREFSEMNLENTKDADIQTVWRSAVTVLKNEGLLGETQVLTRISEEFPRIECNPQELEEIFYHLGKNALQAMGRSGKLIIRAQRVFASNEDLLALISVIDTGSGVPKERVRFLFEPFFTTKPWGEGNGLGLWIVKKLVTKNHGHINIETSVGCGTMFSLTFPIIQKRETEAGTSDPSIGGPLKIATCPQKDGLNHV